MLEQELSDLKNALRERLSIVSLIGEYVPLSKKGQNYFGCCPFHHEKTPSFCVNEEKRLYHCFGCGKGGDVISFYMDIEGASFMEAIKNLASRAGLEVPGATAQLSPAETAQKRREELARELLEKACAFYKNNLHAPSGVRTLSYLKERHIKYKIVEQFELGYAGDRLSLVHELPLNTAEAREVALEIGLLQQNAEGELYNPCAMRLMIPIRDTFGHMVGFGARIIGSGQGAKYLNSAQSFIFDKGSTLFAFNMAKAEVLKRKQLLLVEGYMDVMAAFQLGFPAVAGLLGTALTEHHAKNIAKLKCQVLLGLDSDAAGTKAMLRSAELLLRQGINVSVVRWPAKDPGELLHSPALFTKALSEARYVAAYIIDAAAALLDGSVEKVVAAVELIEPILDALPAGLQKDLYVAMAADALHLGEEQLTQALKKSRDKRRRQPLEKREQPGTLHRNGAGAGGGQQSLSAPKAPLKPVVKPFNQLEVRIVKEIVARKSLWCYISEIVPQLGDERLGQFLTAVANKDALPSLEEGEQLLGDERLAYDVISLGKSEESSSSAGDVLNDLRLSLQEQNFKRELGELQQAIVGAEKAGDKALLAELLRQKKELRTLFRRVKEARRS